MEISFEEKKKKLQNFYDNWVKPMKSIMTPQMLSDLENAIKEYSLVR